MYKIGIVEDQPEEARRLTAHVQRYAAEENVSLKLRTFPDGASFLDEYLNDYDVVFMDIEMPHMNGMETARKLRQTDRDVCLIFVTVMAKYAIEGYAVQALDFILKPAEYQDIRVKLQRALDIREQFATREMTLVTSNGMRRFPIDELYYVEVINHTLYFHTKHGDFVERSTIRQREEQLAPHGFSRCNNSFLVNLRYVSAVENGRITVDGRSISIGRTKRKQFLEELTAYIGEYSL